MTLRPKKIEDYRLTTAEIFYHLPDFPLLLQTYIWQGPDIAPEFPVLNRFLTFWERRLDGKLHSVRICSARLVRPEGIRYAGYELKLH